MYNSEAWHNIYDKDIAPLEKVDEALLRAMLGAHAKTPLEALYLETNSVPIRFILKSRRIMYLHNILQRNHSEMVRKIYELQKRNPCHGDFYEIVRDDMLSLDLNLSEDDISKMKKAASILLSVIERLELIQKMAKRSQHCSEKK